MSRSMRRLFETPVRVAAVVGLAVALANPGVALAAQHLNAIVLGTQTGTVTAPVAGSVTYNANHTTNGSGGAISVTGDAPVFVGGTPAGVTHSYTPASPYSVDGSTDITLTLFTTVATAAGV